MKPHKSFVTDVVIKRNLNRLLYFQKEALYRKRLLFYLIIKTYQICSVYENIYLNEFSNSKINKQSEPGFGFYIAAGKIGVSGQHHF